MPHPRARLRSTRSGTRASHRLPGASATGRARPMRRQGPMFHVKHTPSFGAPTPHRHLPGARVDRESTPREQRAASMERVVPTRPAPSPAWAAHDGHTTRRHNRHRRTAQVASLGAQPGLGRPGPHVRLGTLGIPCVCTGHRVRVSWQIPLTESPCRPGATRLTAHIRSPTHAPARPPARRLLRLPRKPGRST